MNALEFVIDEVRYAVPLARVVEVLPRVALTPLPGAPSVVAGVFNHRGSPTVAVDLRARLGHPARAPSLDDHLLVARAQRRPVALVVDRVQGLHTFDTDAVTPAVVASPHVAGVVVDAGGVLVIEDLDAVLSLDEDRAIDRGLEDLARP
jgi:purine-binding chemotaxis protein CheW